ncbi:DUF982 domain-containing protein [Chelativorans sp.]|uniref:DUF982 domain-containing protein n=1 Tax=Chelativorans sp. TaxID=2203393 RepID=UPI0028128064|nr:DUF982 domain-containing protein [Chelativorans sp.]
MDQTITGQARFATPVRVAFRPGGAAREISNPREAFDYLRNCPVQEGPVFESALEACFVATYDTSCVEEARKGLRTFARAYRLLA